MKRFNQDTMVNFLANVSNAYTQWIAALGVLLLLIQIGIQGGWTSPNMIRLTSENSPISITLSEASWVASYLNLGRFAGLILLPFLLDYLGSKTAILITLCPISLSWVLMVLVNNVEGLYAARFISGISFGLTFGCFPLYLGEISIPEYRGTMISLGMCGLQFGHLVGTIAETYLSMSESSSIYLVQSLIAIAIFIWLPESPYHLVKKNRVNDARKSVEFYRNGCKVEEELNAITNFVKLNCGQNIKDKLGEFKSLPIFKSLVLVIILFSFEQLCGMFTIIFYMETILTNAKFSLVDPKLSVIYVNCFSMLSICLAIRLIDKLGRRILFILSCSGTMIAMLGLGTHFYLLNSIFDPNELQWLALGSILLFTFAFPIGLLTVPCTVLSEIFPDNIKSIASCITSFTSAILAFLASKTYQPMVDSIGEAYMFWIYAAITILAIPSALFFMPETKGKTFQQIQDKLFKR